MPFFQSGSHIGAFADVGGRVSTSPSIDASDFKRAEIALLELAGYVENTKAPLMLSRRIAIDDMSDRFDKQESPDGEEWEDLQPDYQKQKQREAGFVYPILTKSGELRKKATSSAAWTIAEDSIFFNTSILPVYWAAHQFGMSETFHMAGSETLNVEEGDVTIDKIPKRPYIGISADAEEEMLDAFDLWFSEGIETVAHEYFVSSAGTLHLRVAGGRIGPKVVM